MEGIQPNCRYRSSISILSIRSPYSLIICSQNFIWSCDSECSFFSDLISLEVNMAAIINNLIITQQYSISFFHSMQKPTALKPLCPLDFKKPPKIQAFHCLTKIQNAYPHYRSDLVHKQLAFNTIVQHNTGQSETLKECFTASRANAQLYKYISKDFLNNIREGIDQLFLFCSTMSSVRMETSIGLQTNPGFFLVAGISILDEKYREHHENYDVEISFMEYRQGAMFDLLNRTNRPLKPKTKNGKPLLEFGESMVKITTFKQFIKLFKVALFNNGERDQDRNISSTSQSIKSSFIMKLVTKVYSTQGELTQKQENLFIDFEPQLPKKTENGEGDGANSSSKSLWEYILIELNNSNPNNKKIHYHLVQDNYFLSLLKKFLQNRLKGDPSPDDQYIGGQTYFINSFQARKVALKDNLAFLHSILAAAGPSYLCKVAAKLSFNHSFDHEYINLYFQKSLKSIQTHNYTSLRQFNELRSHFSTEVKKWRSHVQEYQRLQHKGFKIKRSKKYSENLMIGYELSLIGSCVKSDHYKDFYTAKSYLSLAREISIKTQDVKNDVLRLIDEMLTVEKDFTKVSKKTQIDKGNRGIKKKQQQVLGESRLKNSSELSRTGNLSFMEPTQSMLEPVLTYIFDYFQENWMRITLSEERTMAEDILYEANLDQQIASLHKVMDSFLNQLMAVREMDINCLQQNTILGYHSHHVPLMVSILGLKKSSLRGIPQGYKGPKHNVTKSQVKPYDPRVKFTRLASLDGETINIEGKVNLLELLIDPTSEPCLRA